MKIVLIGLVGLWDCLVGQIVTQREFIAMADALGEKLYGFAKFKPADCPPALSGQCYMLEASRKSFARRMDYNAVEAYTAPVPVNSLLYYFARDSSQFEGFIDSERSDIKVYTQGDPECKVVRSPLKPLGNSIAGAGSITINQEQINSYSQTFDASAALKLKVSNTSLEIPIANKHFSRAVKEYSHSLVGSTFEASGKACTPAITQLSVACKVKRRVGVFDNDPPLENGTDDPNAYTVIPFSDSVDSFFSPIVGCIENFQG